MQAWKGYYGNVYFEPIQIGQLVTRRVPIDRPWAAADVADSDACHPCDVRVFHLTENFYRKVTDDHRSSPPWVWKSDDRTRGGAGIGSCQPDDRPRFVRSQTNIDRTSGLSSASTVTASPPTASRQQPTRTTPIPTPRRVATARSRSSPVLTGATQRDRFEAASSAVAAVLQMHRLQNFGKQHVGGVFQEPLTVGSIVAASASAAYRAAAIPDPPETSPSVDRLGRRNELQSDKKKIRRGRSVPGRSAAKSRQQQLLQRSTSDRRRQPVDAPEALDAAANICLLAASAQYFRRETSI
jgi:hypothetical protein